MKKDFVLMVICRNAAVIHMYDSATRPVINEIKGCLAMLDRVIIFTDDGVIFDERRGKEMEDDDFKMLFKNREVIRETSERERSMIEKYKNRY